MSQNPNEPKSEDVRNRMASLGLDAEPASEQSVLTIEEVRAIHADPGTFVLEQLVEGRPPSEVTQKLQLAGIVRTEATALVQAIASDYVAVMAARRKAGRGKLIWGGIIIAVGVGVLVGTYQLAAGGGTYIAPIGLFLVGGYYLLKGLAEMSGG